MSVATVSCISSVCTGENCLGLSHKTYTVPMNNATMTSVRIVHIEIKRGDFSPAPVPHVNSSVPSLQWRNPSQISSGRKQVVPPSHRNTASSRQMGQRCDTGTHFSARGQYFSLALILQCKWANSKEPELLCTPLGYLLRIAQVSLDSSLPSGQLGILLHTLLKGTHQ